MLDTNDARVTINGAYALLPEGDIWAHQAWSGDMVGAQYYLPKGVSTDVLGYWYPADRAGNVNNDTMTVPANAQHPVLAHAFLNFMLSKKYGFENFADWVGYQPPQISIKPATLIEAGVVPDKMPGRRGPPGRLRRRGTSSSSSTETPTSCGSTRGTRSRQVASVSTGAPKRPWI